MPILGNTTEEKFVLPSYEGTEDPGWVMMDKNVSVANAFSGLDKKEPSEQTLGLVVASLKDWNFTDEAGAKLDITPDNVKKLRASDFIAIVNQLDLSKLGELPDSKKNS